MLQLVPFQYPASHPASQLPTATQALLDLHETLLKIPYGNRGVGWIAHRDPFHRSANELPREDPTASQNLDEGHETAFSAECLDLAAC